MNSVCPAREILKRPAHRKRIKYVSGISNVKYLGIETNYFEYLNPR